MIAAPPLLAGAVHVNSICVSPGTPTGIPGAPGTVRTGGVGGVGGVGGFGGFGTGTPKTVNVMVDLAGESLRFNGF